MTTAQDRLAVIEHALAMEGLARQSRCPECNQQTLLPVSLLQQGTRSISTWCIGCSAYVEPVVDRGDYARLAFLPSGAVVARVPPDSTESLRGPISTEDLEYGLQQLPNGRAPDDSGLPYELLKGATERMKQVIHACLNSILEGGADPPKSWLGGLVRFLFKKGDPMDIACYRPVCLLDTVYKVLSGILTDRLYRLCEKHGLLDPSQEGFRRLRSTQRQVQGLHWAIEEKARRGASLYLAFLDFDSAFNSPDHEGLWRWLRELNIPDVDLLQALYRQAHYVADLPYGRSAPVYLTRGSKQGDKLSPLLFSLLFNALLLALKASGVGVRVVSGLRSPARGFADDLTLVCESPRGMSRLLQVVSDFCAWSGMRIKLVKSVITAYDFAAREELPTDEIRYQGSPLTRLPADESFPYLGVRASLVRMGKRKGPASSPGLAAEKQHVVKAITELVGIAKHHQYLVGQMVPAMHMVCTSRFRYSAPLVPWTDAELEDMQLLWLRVQKAAWHLPPGYSGAPFLMPVEHGGEALEHPKVVLMQALAKHIEQLVALPDELRGETIARYKQLCDTCGCHNERELSEALAAETKPRQCPLSRFLRVCGQLGIQARLPACLSLGKMEREASWHTLLTHLRRRAAAPDADEVFLSDVDRVAASWAAIRRRFRGRGIKQPRQLVLDPRAQPTVWLIPETMARRPRWLEALLRVLHRVETAAIFPRLDRGGGTPTPAHQALLREVIAGLKDPSVSVSGLFEDVRWDIVRSSAPLGCWVATMRRHGLVSTVQADDLTQRSTGPIADLVTLGTCPEVSRQLLLELVLKIAPSVRTVKDREGDEDRADRGPIRWAPTRLARERVEFHCRDDTAGVADYGPFRASTKDGMVRVMEGSKHVGTISQGRWNLLTSTHFPEDVCAALPGWIAQVEKGSTFS